MCLNSCSDTTTNILYLRFKRHGHFSAQRRRTGGCSPAPIGGDYTENNVIMPEASASTSPKIAVGVCLNIWFVSTECLLKSREIFTEINLPFVLYFHRSSKVMSKGNPSCFGVKGDRWLLFLIRMSFIIIHVIFRLDLITWICFDLFQDRLDASLNSGLIISVRKTRPY